MKALFLAILLTPIAVIASNWKTSFVLETGSLDILSSESTKSTALGFYHYTPELIAISATLRIAELDMVRLTKDNSHVLSYWSYKEFDKEKWKKHFLKLDTAAEFFPLDFISVYAWMVLTNEDSHNIRLYVIERSSDDDYVLHYYYVYTK